MIRRFPFRGIPRRLGILLAIALWATACAAAPQRTTPAPEQSVAPPPAAQGRPNAAATLLPSAGQTAPAPAGKPSATPEPLTLKIGSLRSGAEIGLLAALERGYFTAEGLTLDVTDFSTAFQMVPPLATGDLDVGVGGVSVGLFSAIARGIPMRLVANQVVNSSDSKSTGWVVRTELLDRGRVRGEADFKGLRVALGGQGTIIDVELDEILRRGGLTRDDVELLLISYPDQLVAFANGAADAAYAFEPTKTRMVEAGVAGIWKYSGEVVEDHESSVIVYGPSMETKRDAGQRFMVAYLRGVRDSHREVHERERPSDAMLDILVKHTAIKDRDLWSRMSLQRGNPDGYNYPASLERDARWFFENGLLERPVQLAELLDQTYVDYAVQHLGRYTRP